MNAETLIAELTYPLRSMACALALLGFFLLLTLAAHAGLLGLWLAVVVVPATARFFVNVADSRANGVEVQAPGIELFTLVGNGWTLFPVLPAILLGLLTARLHDSSALLAAGVAFAGACLVSAMLGVLVITHSPMQALNPAALAGLLRRLGTDFLFAPAVLATGFVAVAATASAPWLARLLALYCLCALHALIGALIRERGLLEEIEIPEDQTVRAIQDESHLQHERRICLNHAYALFSRGNRSGALAYLDQWLAKDPDPAGARAWFQEQMLAWEDTWPALCFGQAHLAGLLAAGEKVRAVKLMLRLKGVDPAFRPADADLESAIAAARGCGNPELAAALESPRVRPGRL